MAGRESGRADHRSHLVGREAVGCTVVVEGHCTGLMEEGRENRPGMGCGLRSRAGEMVGGIAAGRTVAVDLGCTRSRLAGDGVRRCRRSSLGWTFWLRKDGMEAGRS